MNRIKLFLQYRKMLRTVRTSPMYDGRGQGTDVYVCFDCGGKFYTEHKDKGCTPFIIHCRFCKEGTMMHEHTVDHAPVGAVTHYWVRPTFKQFPIKCEPSKEDCEKYPLKNNCNKKKD